MELLVETKEIERLRKNMPSITKLRRSLSSSRLKPSEESR
jgi:hypothetical protein